MAYTTPKTDWNESYVPSPADMNRIEANVEDNRAEIVAEETARIAGDNNLAADLLLEESARIAADGVLDDAIGAEESARIAADSSLLSGITSYGGVGSIVIAASTDWNVFGEFLPNSTHNGSTLIRSTSGGQNESLNGNAQNSVEGASSVSLGLTGVWRLLTRVSRSSATAYPTGLFVRIS